MDHLAEDVVQDEQLAPAVLQQLHLVVHLRRSRSKVRGQRSLVFISAPGRAAAVSGDVVVLPFAPVSQTRLSRTTHSGHCVLVGFR